MKLEGTVLNKVDSIELANYLVAKYQPIAHLKLQKLIYYLEAYHLAYFSDSLIEDDFQAWLHGPVSRKLYDYIKPTGANVYGNLVLTDSPEVQAKFITNIETKLTPIQLDLLNDVLKEFNPRSAYDLECLTHEELPWIEARKGYSPGDRCEVNISKETMMKYYADKLYGTTENQA